MPAPAAAGISQRRAEKAVQEREQYQQQQAAQYEPPSREEYQLLQQLHAAQDELGFSGLKADRLVVDGWERMYPEQEYVPHRIFGGYIIRRAYELSAICAQLIVPHRPL